MIPTTPAGRVIEFLRQYRKVRDRDNIIYTVWTDRRAEAAELRTEDLDALLATAADAFKAREIVDRLASAGGYDIVSGYDDDIEDLQKLLGGKP